MNKRKCHDQTVAVCLHMSVHAGICVLKRDGELRDWLIRRERRGDSTDRVTDQDTSIIICLLAAAWEFNIASASLWLQLIGCYCLCIWETEGEILRKRCLSSLQMSAHTHPGWCFCVCVSQSLFHQSVSINSSNTARQLRSMMCYITLSKCILRPHQHQQLGCYLF